MTNIYKALSGCLLSSLEKGKWNGKWRNRGVKKAGTNLNYSCFIKAFAKTNLPVYKLQMQPRISEDILEKYSGKESHLDPPWPLQELTVQMCLLLLLRLIDICLDFPLNLYFWYFPTMPSPSPWLMVSSFKYPLTQLLCTPQSSSPAWCMNVDLRALLK